jgi:hypothetical protein
VLGQSVNSSSLLRLAPARSGLPIIEILVPQAAYAPLRSVLVPGPDSSPLNSLLSYPKYQQLYITGSSLTQVLSMSSLLNANTFDRNLAVLVD